MIRAEAKRVLPSVDALYWVTLLAATALGEKLGDLVSMTFGLAYGPSAMLLVALAIGAILLHLLSAVSVAPLYWTAIVLTSTAGTTVADFVTRTLGLGYAIGSALLIALLLATATLSWWLKPRAGLDSHMSPAAEAVYWAEMLVAGTLGTATGDFLANSTRLGFGNAALVLLGCTAVIAVLAGLTRLPRVPLYWSGILVIDPIGATLGDYLDKPEALGFGVVSSVAMLSCALAIVVAYGMRHSSNDGLRHKIATKTPRI